MITSRFRTFRVHFLTWALLALAACGEDSIVAATDMAADANLQDEATAELPPPDADDATQSQSDAAQSDAAESDMAGSETAESDTAPSDTAQSDTAESDTAESDTAGSDAAGTDIAGSDTADADAPAPDAPQSDALDADAAGADASDAEAQTDTTMAEDAATSPDVLAETDAVASDDSASPADAAGATDITGEADALDPADQVVGTDAAAASDVAADSASATDAVAASDAESEPDTVTAGDAAPQSDTAAAADQESADDAADAGDAEQAADATDGDDATAAECVGALDCPAPGTPCQLAVCYPDGTCGTTAAADGALCDDGDACTELDACAAGTCKGNAVSCDDGNSCTLDLCDPATGCGSAIDPSATCSDNDACTESDACDNGTCVANPLLCDDDQACTLDSCESGECQHTEIPGCFAIPCAGDLDCPTGSCDLPSHRCRECNTDVDCGPGAWCSAHVCLTGPVCSSDIQCKATGQVCHPTQGVCVDCASAGDCAAEQACVESKCVAAKPCTSSKQCPAVCDTQQGICVECLGSADCPASSWCDASSHVCRPDVCAWTECQGAKAFACLADGSGYAAGQACTTVNPCLGAACADKIGCFVEPVAASCTDGDACTLGDVCVDGGCVSGPAKLCSDGNACTVDAACQSGSCPAYVSAVSLLAGSGAAAYANGTGAAAAFSYIRGLAVAPDGTVYVAELGSIRKVSPDGVVTLHAGGSTTGFADGPLGTGKLWGAWGIALAANGDLYVTDWTNNRVRKVTPDGTITTLAGSGESGFQDGPALTAKFHSPSGIVLEPDGGVLVAEYGGARIRRIKDGVVSTVAGTGTKGTADGPALQAQFHTPGFLLRSPQGHIYVADVETDRIRKLSATGVVTTLAGGTQGYQNGSGSNARFDAPEQMTWISDSEFLVAELLNHRIRKVTVDGEVSLYAGTGTASSVSGPLSTATFNQPVGLAKGPGGVLYLTENASNLLRRIVPKDLNCSDGDTCTLDFCSPIDGCGHAPAVQCDDGDPCTEGDACDDGACVLGTPVNCDDNNPCTTDTCGPSGCAHANLDAGTSCGNGLSCNEVGKCTCGNGICESGEGCCPADCGVCGPPWIWNAVDLSHKYGVAENGGWKCTTKICSGKDHMVYGPDATFFGPGTYKATFQFKASPECDNFSCSNTYLADMDVCIDDGLTILASGKVMYVDIQAGISDNWWTERSLTFTVTGQATAEFRVRWNAGGGDTAKLVVGQIRVDKL